MKFDIEIPKELAHLKLDERGYPIPYFVRMDNGKPNFRLQDTARRDDCIDHRKCHICGKKLPKDYCYNITGPQGLKNKVSSDAFMHRGCAEFALRACPHIYYHKAERKEDPGFGQGVGKPSEVYLVKISTYNRKNFKIFQKSIVTGKEEPVTTSLIAYNPVSWEKYIYQDNVLVLEPMQNPPN